MTVVDEFSRSKYVNLTTYRKDGTAVATPVWSVRNGAELIIISETAAGKVKRVRNNPRVVVTVCGVRGKIAPGAASAEGTARLLDVTETEAGRRLLARKYLLSRIGNGLARALHLRQNPMTGISVTF